MQKCRQGEAGVVPLAVDAYVAEPAAVGFDEFFRLQRFVE
jgi:hypothetical protein